MRTLGKFVVMTHDELEQRNNDARALGYRAGLKSKWRLKKKGEIESLLASVAPEVVLPQRKADLSDFISRNAETYEKPKAGILDVMKMTWVGPDDPTPSSTVDVRTYGDSLPIKDAA